ncbi:MAG TPA: hypothetical protein VF944_04455 [Candidatus Bathyarchaeia archaeon]
MFNPELVSFLTLLHRSKDAGGGWREYSEDTELLVLKTNKRFPGLFEFEDNRIRLSHEGKVLMKWMNYVPK